MILDGSDVKVRIPFSVLKIALEPLMRSVMEYLVNQEMDVLKTVLYKSNYGYPFQKLLTDILKEGGTYFSFDTINQIKLMGTTSIVKHSFQEIKKGAYSMKSISAKK